MILRAAAFQEISKRTMETKELMSLNPSESISPPSNCHIKYDCLYGQNKKISQIHIPQFTKVGPENNAPYFSHSMI